MRPPGRLLALLRRAVPRIARSCGRGAAVVELGSGSRRKTELLLAALDLPAVYVPIDVSAQFLGQSVRGLRTRFPRLAVDPLVADFTHPQALRGAAARVAHATHGQRLAFFPGSTIGNLTPQAATALLGHIGQALGRGTLLVIGADATQDPALLIPAHDDSLGVTAAFNKNLLVRVNRELGSNFELGRFEHQARWNAGPRRIEMHLVARVTHEV